MQKTPNSCYGLKENHIESEILNIIDSAQEYILMGSYNFNLPHNILKKLQEKAKKIDVVVILPSVNSYTDKNTGEKKESFINDPEKIKGLIDNKIGVIIKENNHSKFIISKNSYYMGSANLSWSGLNNKVENIYIVNGDKNPLRQCQRDIKNDIKEKFDSFIDEYLNDKNCPRNVTDINNETIQIISDVKNNTYKLNPNKEKVRRTVQNFWENDKLIIQSISNYFNTLNFDDYFKISQKLSCLRKELKEVAEYGYSNILFNDDFREKEIEEYNRLWLNFNNYCEEASEFIERNKFSTECSYTIKNMEILNNYIKPEKNGMPRYLLATTKSIQVDNLKGENLISMYNYNVSDKYGTKQIVQNFKEWSLDELEAKGYKITSKFILKVMDKLEIGDTGILIDRDQRKLLEIRVSRKFIKERNKTRRELEPKGFVTFEIIRELEGYEEVKNLKKEFIKENFKYRYRSAILDLSKEETEDLRAKLYHIIEKKDKCDNGGKG